MRIILLAQAVRRGRRLLEGHWARGSCTPRVTLPGPRLDVDVHVDDHDHDVDDHHEEDEDEDEQEEEEEEREEFEEFEEQFKQQDGRSVISRL